MESDRLKLKHRIVRRAMAFLTPITIAGFRRLDGRVFDRITLAAPITLLTTRGRRTGLERTVAVGHMKDGHDVIVYGSGGGMPREPAWTLNLRAHPWARVELGKETFEAEAEFLAGDERDRLWTELVSAYPIYGRLPAWTEREIPVIRLRPLATDLDQAP